MGVIELTDSLSLGEARDGWWLYDKTRGMKLAMRSKTERDAFVAALEYYQRRLLTVETAYRELAAKVDAFVSQVVNNEEDPY